MREYAKLYIGGEWVDPLEATAFALINPATEEPYANIALGGTTDVDRAVKAARKAFETFSVTSSEERAQLLERIAEALNGMKPQIAATITEELGTPVSAMIHVDGSVALFRQAAQTLRAYDFEAVVDGTLVRREPIGVAGIITAWNWPLQLLCTKISSALAAGCTVVAKPSEFTATTAILMTQAFVEAGIPAGVFNLVLGDGPTVGAAITTHPDIDMISFTGSTRAGVIVAQNAAPTVKRVCQELGGKSANIVLPDANLKEAIRFNVQRAFQNAGQSCHAPSRMLIHDSQLPEAERLVSEIVGSFRVGDPLDPRTTIGPVINRAQFDRVNDYIEAGISEGARLVCGGPGRPDGLEKGYFVQPTVFFDVIPGMKIEQEEIFGPVLAVLSWSDIDEAIRIANGTDYGLGAYLFTSDVAMAAPIGRKLRAGRVFLNGAPSTMAAPMGGYRRSGNGREMGICGLEEYLEVKAMFGFEMTE